MTNITDIIDNYREYSSSLKPVTKEWLGSDYHYHTLVKNISETKSFNYHSDYWGYADDYQEANVEVMAEIKPYIGKEVILDDMKGKFLGMLIDKQYNSLNHTKLLFDKLEEVI